MFYYISGILAHREAGLAVIDCGGVGYKLTVSQNTLAELDRTASRTDKVKLFTHMAVREDDVELFGFYTEEELSTFKLLLTVSGVGPKAAMGVLSAFTPEGLARAVTTEDTKAISRANGIGAKGAARIVLELKDKLSYVESGEPIVSTKIAAASPKSSSKLTEAAEALAALGYSRAEINSVLAKINTDKMESGDIIRAALAQFMK
ncbi:MAG: Holliday junction branch migration protein RuvA [Ruminococcaceae bacterium]|nr:Holliday junction branch migration protein RuvA [Oscillospiraceae bacterium]